MKRTYLFLMLMLMWMAAPVLAQWRIGGGGGYGFTTNGTVKTNAGSADAGLKPGPAGTAFVGQDLLPHLGGEIRYTIQFTDLKLKSGGTEFTFGGRTHAISYDLLIYGTRRKSEWRPYALVGGGAKIYEGTGFERAIQPLSQFAILTKTRDIEGMFTFGGGLEWKLSDRVFMRADVRDYVSPVPTKVIFPVGRLSGWLHNIVPALQIGVGF